MNAIERAAEAIFAEFVVVGPVDGNEDEWDRVCASPAEIAEALAAAGLLRSDAEIEGEHSLDPDDWPIRISAAEWSPIQAVLDAADAEVTAFDVCMASRRGDVGPDFHLTEKWCEAADRREAAVRARREAQP